MDVTSRFAPCLHANRSCSPSASHCRTLCSPCAFCIPPTGLAVGSQDGRLAVFDLKTATIWKVAQAHEAPVSATVFDAACKHLLTYSLVEKKWKIWQVRVQWHLLMSLSAQTTPEASSVGVLLPPPSVIPLSDPHLCCALSLPSVLLSCPFLFCCFAFWHAQLSSTLFGVLGASCKKVREGEFTSPELASITQREVSVKHDSHARAFCLRGLQCVCHMACSVFVTWLGRGPPARTSSQTLMIPSSFCFAFPTGASSAH